ncbi:MAG: hypothetical protein JXQ73_09065 [Phycisphaerae bacterium]|nr:hypothetical protein [Phycisphaerae bacterium]
MKAKLAVMSLSLFVLAGCNKAIVGKWQVDKNAPELKQAKTIIKSAEFTDDGVYRADVIQTSKEGLKETKMTTGKYQFNGFQLKLSSKEGDQVWNAVVYMNRTLELKRSGDKLKLKRVE